ncbi:MAG: CARDB domain-containing protein, partial [Planctomycetota bacterium]
VNMPPAIELQNINVSNGHHEIRETGQTNQLTWTLDTLPPNTTHTIAINAIPRSAEPFELEVEWTTAPKSGFTQIEVTEPKLEMKISGPSEVMFGEKATYDVTVFNPGTGTAEQVSVMLPQELGGEKANIGNVEAGSEKKFKVELFARTAGQMNLTATAIGGGNIEAAANHNILVRRANLNVRLEGPQMKYAGSLGQYIVTVTNDGDATATDVVAALAIPQGVKYLGGINNADANESGLKWKIGTLTSGDQRTYKVNCQLDVAGNLVFQAGARGAGELAATGDTQTKVDTIADLTLNVQDPKGPLPVGEDVEYKLVIRNRGTRSANGVEMVMQFSEGIEPIKADGFKNKITPGQVEFAPIGRIEPGQEIVLYVTAQAMKGGAHLFRGELVCKETETREVDEGTTRFFGDDVANQALGTPSNTADLSGGSSSNDFK